MSRKWHHIDASSLTLGRLATKVATLLRGKHKRTYTSFIDCGDFVVVTNADQLKITGNKLEAKFYFRHSGYNDGAKVIPFKRQLENDSTKIIRLAVRRMLGDNKLRDRRMRRLKVFKNAENPYAARTTEKTAEKAAA